jgi:hypothetical protein
MQALTWICHIDRPMCDGDHKTWEVRISVVPAQNLVGTVFWLEVYSCSWNLHCHKVWHSVSFATHFAVIQEWRNATTQEREVDNRKTEIILCVIYPRLLGVFLIHRCWSNISVDAASLLLDELLKIIRVYYSITQPKAFNMR